MQATILPIPNYTKIITQALELKEFQVAVVLELTLEWSTVPFIARYRKERTGNLDENDIRAIIELQTKEENGKNDPRTHGEYHRVQDTQRSWGYLQAIQVEEKN